MKSSNAHAARRVQAALHSLAAWLLGGGETTATCKLTSNLSARQAATARHLQLMREIDMQDHTGFFCMRIEPQPVMKKLDRSR